MGGCKRPAALVLITIGADLVAAALAGLPARVEVALVGVLRDVYPEYVIDQDDRRAGFGVDSINVVAKRAGLSVNYRAFATWSDTLAALERAEIDLIPVVAITPPHERHPPGPDVPLVHYSSGWMKRTSGAWSILPGAGPR